MQQSIPKPNQQLAEHGGGGSVMSIIDDIYLMGPPQHIFPTNEALKMDLEEVGLGNVMLVLMRRTTISRIGNKMCIAPCYSHLIFCYNMNDQQ